MSYKRIKMEFQYFKDRFYRELLVREDLNLVYLGCIMCTCIGAEFEHLFLFHKKKISYVPDAFLENSSYDNWLPMKEYTLEDLGDNFIFEYDTGDGWCFNCKVYKKEVEKQGITIAYLLDGKGQGIWEDNIYSLYKYLNGEIDPNSSEEDEEKGIYLPWNFSNEKYSDFENYDLEFEQDNFEDSYLVNISMYLAHSHEYGYELEINDFDEDYYESLNEDLDDDYSNETLNDDISDYNPHLHKYIMDVVDNQIKTVDYIKETFNRLKKIYGKDEAKRKIAVVLTEEIFKVLKENKESDEKEYRKKIESIN